MSRLSRLWPILAALSILAVSELAQAAKFIHPVKPGAVVAYREESEHSRIIGVLKENVDVEISSEDTDWYKIKFPYGDQSSFLFGFVRKQDQGNYQIIDKKAVVVGDTPSAAADHENEQSNQKSRSRNEKGSDNDMDGIAGRSFTFSTGPIYSLYRYGAYQYLIAGTYEQELSPTLRIGVPVGYVVGNGFSDFDFGLQAMYGIKIKSLSIVPKLGAGYGYFFGNGKSFHSLLATAGIDVEYQLTKYLSFGIEPFNMQVMAWNSTDSLNKVPWNIRAESLVSIRGRW